MELSKFPTASCFIPNNYYQILFDMVLSHTKKNGLMGDFMERVGIEHILLKKKAAHPPGRDLQNLVI